MSITTISADQFSSKFEENPNAHILDVRTPAEFNGCHVQGAVCLPLQDFNVTSLKALLAKTTPEGNKHPIFLICQKGARAKMAAEKLNQEISNPIYVIDGGTDACVERGIPVNEGKKAISLERQVRIAAGSLTVLGVVFGSTIDPAYYGISAFVGAGLVFAGVTDTCAMGMMLARMPWNKA